ncbi:hypothetical protein GCM10027405_07960 [Arthrobacter alkaliphilus]
MRGPEALAERRVPQAARVPLRLWLALGKRSGWETVSALEWGTRWVRRLGSRSEYPKATGSDLPMLELEQ